MSHICGIRPGGRVALSHICGIPGADLGGGLWGCNPPNIRIVLPAHARMRVCTYVRRYRSGRRHTHAELLTEWRMA